MNDDLKHYSHGIYRIRAVLNNDYLEYAKYENPNTPEEKLKYLIFISKKFFAESPREIYENDYGFNYKVIRDDLGFFPQFHYLELIKTNDKFEDFTVNPYEAFCCAVEINTEDGVKDFRYGHMIDSAEWTLYNQSNDFTIERYASTQSPFMANTTKNALPSGYYDISFKYSLVNGKTNKYTLNSAFRINKM
jgi:hypothetical protein